MKYAMLIFTEPGSFEALGEAEQHQVHGEYMAITQSPGIVGGEQLQGVETATTVRVRDGQTLTTDGPFADTKEIFAGFYLLDAGDLDTAIALAEKIPAARMGGSVEVRPVQEMNS
ncbi:MAG: YciI family protein [Solirubrobacteraceae bacterium]